MGFFKFLCDWGEDIFEANRERIVKTYGLKEFSLDDTSSTTSKKSDKPANTVKTVSKLNTLEAHN